VYSGAAFAMNNEVRSIEFNLSIRSNIDSNDDASGSFISLALTVGYSAHRRADVRDFCVLQGGAVGLAPVQAPGIRDATSGERHLEYHSEPPKN
jgi:hypothetical protein